MASCLTKAQITAELSLIEEIYIQFLKGPANGGIDNVTAHNQVTAILDSNKPYEYNLGNYGTRVVCVCPDNTSPVIVLNLLYVAPVPGKFPVECSTTECLAVSITFVPHPNGLQPLSLTPNTKTLYKDGRIVGGYDLADSITAYDHSVQADGDTTECLIICGTAKKCDTADCLDFLSYLCDKLETDFVVKRDKCGKLWLITLDWTDDDFPYDHKDCVIVEEEEICTYYVDYEKLRCYYEKKSCFRFDECDPAQLSQTTRCFEIYFTCIEGEIVVNYSTSEHEKLPKCFREIAQTCNFICEPIPSPTTKSIHQHPSGEFDTICRGNYTCVRRLYCCIRDKCEKYRKYHQCCRKHAHAHHHFKKCKTKCVCEYTKKYGDGEKFDPEVHLSDHEVEESYDGYQSSGHGGYQSETKQESDCCVDEVEPKYESDCCVEEVKPKYESDNRKSDGYGFTCPYKKSKCCYKNTGHRNRACRNECCYGQSHYTN